MAPNSNCFRKEIKFTVYGGSKLESVCVCEGAPKKRISKRKINSDVDLEATTNSSEVSTHVPITNSSSESFDVPSRSQRISHKPLLSWRIFATFEEIFPKSSPVITEKEAKISDGSASKKLSFVLRRKSSVYFYVNRR